ncbi:hypothetical protein EDC96DRAFT_553688 [Choanephora cucurbitarum]|nr:hypothetical protein EDC96DRAFT_553688 [Choanephora cucurbitarum]
MFQNSGFQSGPSKGVRLSFLTQADQAKFEQLFAQSAGPYGGSKIPAQTVSDLLRRSNLDNDTLAKIWDLSSIANAPHLTFPEFAVAMFLTSKKLTGQALPASLPPDVREETEIAMATIESTETSRQLVSTSTPPIQPQQQFMNQQLPMMTGMPPQMTSIQPQMTSMQPQMTSMQPQMPMMTGRPTPPPVPQLPMQTGFSNNFQTPMQTGFQPSQPPTKPRLQNLDFAKKMMPNQSGVTNLLNPNLGTKDSERISWKISPEEKQRYREIFDAWDGTGTGFMSGETAKDVLTQSQLPPEDLMKIWTLADSDNKGSLDNDEFAIAMHLVYRKLNGFEIPSVLPPELRPPSSVLKKFVIGRRAPSAMPSFGSPPARREENEDSLYGNNQHDYVSSSRRKGPPPSVSARSSSNYSSLDQEEDARVLEDLRRQISDTQRQLNRMPKVTTSSSYSNKYSLEELKEKIRRAHEDLHHATRTNHLSSKYFENKETLLGLIETQKSLQDEIQYLCNRDIPVLARQLRSSAAELRDAKVRNSRKTDTAQDYMAYVQPTGPGGSITESDRVRAKAKAMMAARKAGSTGSSSDASFVLRRAEEEKEEIDRRADTIERDMEKARTSLLDMRGDLKYLEEMTAAKDLEDKKRFDNGQDLSYELRRFIEQLDTKTTELGSYARAPDNFRSSAASSPALSTSGYQSPSMGASSPALSSPAPKPSPVRPRTAEEIKKEAERRVQERLAAIQAKRNPGSSPRISAPSTSFAASPTNNKPNESEAEAERAAQEMLRASVNQREELDRKKREADLERMREDERLERQRQEQREREKAEEEQRARIQQEEDEKRREQEDREFEERRRQRLAKEEADRQARFDAIKRHEEEEEAKKAQDTSYKPEEAPASESTPPPVSEPSAAPNAISTNNPFAKFQQSTTAEPSSPQTEKPNEPASKRVSYNPFAAFSAFSATKGGNQDDSDSDDDDGWDVTHNDSEDENEFPAAGSAKNLAGMLFDAMSKRNDNGNRE